MQYFVLLLYGSKYYLNYIVKAVHILAILDLGTPLVH